METPPFRVRMNLGPAAESLAPTAGERGYLHVKAADFQLNLLMSSVANMMDLIEDEVIPPAMPMFIEVSKAGIGLKVSAQADL